ncbi:MAG: hypothetical protein E7398_00285 [Ruminococcaceae bacterium]|nr:hypothetical protein [Oscillospiraceae bacterium]
MNTVSENWKSTHDELLLPETFIKLSLGVTEPGLSLVAETTATNEETFSEAEKITNTLDKEPEKYATLEHNMWGLDGTFDFFDETPVDAGYTTSLLSNADGSFSSVPTLTIQFSSVRTALIPGITITWGNAFDEYATSFRITVYNGTTVVFQKNVTDNASNVSQIFTALQGYDKIVIEVLEWCLPHHRCRITEVFLGIRESYTKSALLSYDHIESADLLSAALPKNEIVFSLDNSTGRWNPSNPSGAEQYLIERQEIVVKYGMRVGDNIEWIDGGSLWLSEWNTPANGLEATFTARDSLTFANEVYTGIRKGTLYNIATAAFEQMNLPLLPDGSPRFYVDESLKNLSTDFSAEDTEYTIAEVLQMVAHMGCCVFYQSRDGKLRIEQHNSEVTDYVINRFRSYAHPEVSYSKPLKAVEVTYGDNQKTLLSVASSGEVQTVTNEFIKTNADAQKVAKRTADVLKGRQTISGEYRADPRLSALDVVAVESKYADSKVAITEIKYTTTGGAFKGTYTGRIVG